MNNPVNHQTLIDWLHYIQQIHHQAIDLGFERLLPCAQRLGIKQFDCPVITVAGTNGKGSCVKFIESVYLQQGYRVAAYTSPHLLKFNERLRIQGIDIDDASLIEAFHAVEAARQNITLSFFEFTTLACFYILARRRLDVIVLEIGLGGRLDAVNMIDADVAVITTIDLDHTQWLGPRREDVAQEKAGIFKPNSLAVCGDADAPEIVEQIAHRQAAPLYRLKRNYDYGVDASNWWWRSEEYEMKNLPLPILNMRTIATAIMAIVLLRSRLPISEDTIRQVLPIVSLPGRHEQVQYQGHDVLLDVAHNPQSMTELSRVLKEKWANRRYIVLLGMLSDKDIENSIKPLLPIVFEWHFVNLPSYRSATATTLMEILEKQGMKNGYIHDNVAEALQIIGPKLKQSRYENENDLLVVCGSFYTVADFKECNDCADINIYA